jgi:hypothetical protein
VLAYVYYTGTRGIVVEAGQRLLGKAVPPSGGVASNTLGQGQKYMASLRVGEELGKGASAVGVELLKIRKGCLVQRGCNLEREPLILGSDVILSNRLSINGVDVVVNVSKGALLTLQEHRQLNSEIIDAAMFLTSARVMECNTLYIPSTLLPSEPCGALVFRSWKWLQQNVSNKRQFLFLLHEEHIKASAGHYNFLFVELPSVEGRSGKIHVFDPGSRIPPQLVND